MALLGVTNIPTLVSPSTSGFYTIIAHSQLMAHRGGSGNSHFQADTNRDFGLCRQLKPEANRFVRHVVPVVINPSLHFIFLCLQGLPIPCFIFGLWAFFFCHDIACRGVGVPNGVME